MKNSSQIIALALDLLSPMKGVTAKSMFGGHGIFKNSMMFALVAFDVLYLKVDDSNKKRFEKQGLGPFVYTGGKKPMTMSYYEVPAEAMEDSALLCDWAKGAFDAAKRAAAKKKPKKKK
ncbi:MAG: TfoX/Sxy family protein [Proteobacteria bacterium]|nr:TfoX/Sxy family protein [Pseudomonadota bacterium]